MKKFTLKYLFFIALLTSPAGDLKADYINLIQADKCETIIEMFIEDDSLRITFEIGENDYQWFHHVIPERYLEGGFSEKNQRDKFKKFFRETFLVHTDNKLLTGEVVQVKRIDRILRASLYTGKVDTTSTASKYVVFVEAVYPLRKKPKRISFTPPLKQGYEVTFANIGFVTYHKMIPINDIRYLGRTEALNLNWKDPWYTNFDNRNLRRHHSSSILSFLYIDPYEVRHEILARIMDLANWIDLDYQLDDIIKVKDQDSLKNRIADFLINRNKVIIDGEESNPIIDKIHFVKVALSGIQVMDAPVDLPYSSAIIGVIFTYPNPGIPQKVTVEWDLFADKINQIPNVATDPAGPMRYILMPDDSILVWQNFLKKYKIPTVSEVKVTNASLNLPLLSIVFALAIVILIHRNGKRIFDWSKNSKRYLSIFILLGLVTFPLQTEIEIPFLKKQGFSKPEASALITQLLKNTYRAFDFREENDIYDKLAISYDGKLLTDVYLETKKSMVLENQGGIQVKVKDVELVEVDETGSAAGGLAYECQWRVSGNVGHWGHIHRRTNQYRAILSIRPVDGVWKMFDLDMIEEVRL
jgi:hypothetical protein